MKHCYIIFCLTLFIGSEAINLQQQVSTWNDFFNLKYDRFKEYVHDIFKSESNMLPAYYSRHLCILKICRRPRFRINQLKSKATVEQPTKATFKLRMNAYGPLRIVG